MATGEVTLGLSGMSCVTCAATIEDALRSVEGVISVAVNFAAEKAAVRYNPEVTTVARLKKAVADAGELESEGKTAMLMAVDRKLAGLIAVADTLKESAAQAIGQLHQMGVETVMITGDNRRTAQAIAQKVGIREAVAEVLPEDKAKEVRKLQEGGRVVAMVGDGINDAPALAQADVGIALGSGTDVAMESGDIVLVKDDLWDVVEAIRLSRYTIRKIKQNLFWAFFYNTSGIPIAAGVLYPLVGLLLNPIIAAAAMGFSSVSVVTNSLLMKSEGKISRTKLSSLPEGRHWIKKEAT